MTGWIHLLFLTASVASLAVIRLRRAHREALRDLAVLAFNPEASGHDPAGSSASRTRETRNSMTVAGHV
jgi:hypothetical protein